MDARQREYARLLVRVGVNLQPGQILVINAPVGARDFARACVAEAYDAGAREVFVSWRDDWIARETYLRAAEETFDQYPAWDKLFMDETTEAGAAFLTIAGSDPESLQGVSADRIRRAKIASGKALEKSRAKRMSNFNAWCVGAVPEENWAKKVFPELSGEEAFSRLWEEILRTVRVDGQGDPVEAWQTHVETLKGRIEKLNGYRFQVLRYRNALGTDLTVELPQRHIWCGAEEKTRGGVRFVPNMPTEEIFSAPKRDGVNGVVFASMPLVLSGNIVEGIRLELRGGRIVSAAADRGEEFLRDAISVDEGASYLGEVALVPKDSPVSRSKRLFYNTLFDENASCHFAFGASYPCVEDAGELSREQLAERGLNDSITHVDFMVGTEDLSITGILPGGGEIPVFREGSFVF